MSSRCLRTGLLYVVLLSTSCGDDTGVNTRDTIAPAAIVDLQARTIIEGSINLVWTAPGDDSLTGRASQYAIRLASEPITPETWDSASLLTGVPKPKQSGRIDAFTVTGLMPDRYFFIAVRVADEANNWSGLSNVAIAYSTPGVDPGSPAMITDLLAIDSTETSVTLTWTAVGDDSLYGRASRYEVKYDTVAIDAISWSDAIAVGGVPLPSPPGVADNVTVGGLHDSTIYYFGIKAIDDIGKSGRLSNIVQTSTMLSSDSAPPATVTDLEVIDYTTSSITIRWTSPGDDATDGIAVTYDLRYHTSPINPLNWDAATVVAGVGNPKPGGEVDTVIITGLERGVSYYVALRASDERPNWSELSNVVMGVVNAMDWQVSIGGSGEDVANSVTVSADNGIVVAGKTNSSGAGDYDAYVVKIDTDGNVVWERTFGGAAEDVANDIISTSDGGFVFVGYTWSIGAGKRDIWLVKLDPDGNMLWEKTFGGAALDVANSVVEMSGGGLVFSGTSISFGPAWWSPYLLKTDAEGNEIWLKTFYGQYHHDGLKYAGGDGGSVAVTDDDALLFNYWLGFEDYSPLGGWYPYEKMYLAKIDSLGDAIWSTKVAGSNGISPKVGAVAASSQGGSSATIIHVRVYRCDYDGDIMWSILSGTLGFVPAGLVVLSGDRVAVVGSTGSASLVALNSEGAILYTEMHGGSASDGFLAVTELPNGGIIAVGYTDSFGDSRDIYIVKLRP